MLFKYSIYENLHFLEYNLFIVVFGNVFLVQNQVSMMHTSCCDKATIPLVEILVILEVLVMCLITLHTTTKILHY
jgi:hypothetical protein